MLQGKFVGPGIYVSDLDETHSYIEILSLSFEQFKTFISFLMRRKF